MMHWWARLLSLALAASLVSCADEAPTARRASPLTGGPARRIALGAARPAQATLLVRARWGSQLGELGMRDEASRPGPMSLAVAPRGGLYVLDQVNRRIVHFDDRGGARRAIPIAAETAEDLALVGGDAFVLFYEPGPAPGYRVERLRLRDGQLRGAITLGRDVQLVTGIVAAGDPRAPDVLVEVRQQELVPVLRRGVPVPPAKQRGGALLGRAWLATRYATAPSGDGRRATVQRVLAARYTTSVLEIDSGPERVLAMESLHVAPPERLYVGLVLGQGFAVRRALLVEGGGPALLVELSPARYADAFRTVAVAPDGDLYELASDEQGVTIRRWATGARRP